MSKKPIPHPHDFARRNPWVQAVTPTSLGVLSAAVAAFGPKGVVPDVLTRLPGSDYLGLNKLPTRVYLALIGFVAGYSATHSVNWVRWNILKSLLAYKGWVYGVKSYKVKAWALLIRLLRGPSPYETFAFQPYLPKQPLPDLDTTLDRWLGAAKQFVSAEEFEQTVEAVEEFRETVGPRVQAYLQEKANKEDNWVADYWVNLAYLAGRDPIAVNNNYYLLNASHETFTQDPIARAASTVYLHMKFRQALLEDRVQPAMLNELVPLCMHGCRYIFSTVRLPGETMDSLQRFPSSKHIVVIRKGHYFQLDITAPDTTTRRMRPLTPQEWYQQFTKVQQLADSLPSASPVASLTAQNRTVWAKHRELLKERNEDTLAAVESALFIVVLDDQASKDSSDFALRVTTGTGYDRWFDKCFSLVTSPTGTRLGWNVEHTVIDAMVMGLLTEDSFTIEKRLFENGALKKDAKPPRDLRTPNRLEWDVVHMKDEIDTAYRAHRAVTDDLDLIIANPPFGKGVMKKCRVSPDGFIQMALQLAYYRLHKEIPKTYEPSTSRMFVLGRTETIHPASADSVAWVKAMDDPKSTNQSRSEFLKRAIKHQTQFRLEATIGEGCDRHLLALFCASRELGMDVPKVFMDKAWRMPFKLSTSQTPTKLWDYGPDHLDYWGLSGGFAPSCPEGYGISYIILGDDIINIGITSWKSCSETGSTKFAEALSKAFHDMKAIFLS